MERDEIDAELSLLMDEMEGDYGDRHEIYMRLIGVLDSMRAFGLPVPDDLVEMERNLAAELTPPDSLGDGGADGDGGG